MARLSPTLLSALAALTLAAPVLAQQQGPDARSRSPFRPPVNYVDEPTPPAIPPEVRDERRVARSYPEQPPVIPHSIQGYQVDLNNNQCLTCHSRQFTEAVQAPMVSITHYLNRQGQMLGALSPRRYFCTQCHVPQTVARPIVDNQFLPYDELVERRSAEGG